MLAHGNTERLGINAVEAIFLRDKWLFREQTVSDWGIDAHAEPTEDDEPLGRLAALQIKTGPSYFVKRGDGYVYRGSKRHLDYWLRHALPVYIILHNPEVNLTLWQKVEQYLVTINDSGRWSIQIPKSNVLNDEALRHIKRSTASDPNSFRRYLMALDYPMMKRFFHRKAYMRVMEY